MNGGTLESYSRRERSIVHAVNKSDDELHALFINFFGVKLDSLSVRADHPELVVASLSYLIILQHV
jgi:hypothetical protein